VNVLGSCWNYQLLMIQMLTGVAVTTRTVKLVQDSVSGWMTEELYVITGRGRI
jgi:hypothetical protein